MAQMVVRSMTVEADGVMGIELVAQDGAELPAWQPGAHVALVLGGGLTRQYSLCGDPADRRRYLLGVLRDLNSRGGSEYVHTVLRPGDPVEIRGPSNRFRLEPAAHYIFIAGGIGITPILPMVAAARAAGADWTLTYGGRTAASMAFTERFHITGTRVQLHPQDTHGLLDLDSILGTPRADTLVYCCGPEALLAAVEERCARWPAGALHTERFAGPVDAPVSADGERDVEVVLATSNRTLTVPADRAILDVLLDAGIEVLNDCREGICGSCETKVIDGAVDHRDFVLTDRERQAGSCMMVCVSRALGGRLVLDL